MKTQGKLFNRIGLEWGSSFHKNGSQKKKQTLIKKEQNLPADFYVQDIKRKIVLKVQETRLLILMAIVVLSDKSTLFLLWKVCAFPPALLYLDHWTVRVVRLSDQGALLSEVGFDSVSSGSCSILPCDAWGWGAALLSRCGTSHTLFVTMPSPLLFSTCALDRQGTWAAVSYTQLFLTL